MSFYCTEEPKEEPEDSDMPDPPTLEEEELLIKKEEEDGQVTPVEESVSGIDLPDGAGEEEETDEKPPVLSSLEDEEPGDVAWSPNAPVSMECLNTDNRDTGDRD